MVNFNNISNIDELLKIADGEVGVINEIDKLITYADSLRYTKTQQLSKRQNIYWDAAAQANNLKSVFENLKMQVQGLFEQTVSAANAQVALKSAEEVINGIYNLIGFREIPSERTDQIYDRMSNILHTFVEVVTPALQRYTNTQDEQTQQQQGYEGFYPEQTTTDYS